MAIQAAAKLLGARSAPSVTVVSVTSAAAPTSMRRHLQLNPGVLVAIEAEFEPSDTLVALNIAKALRDDPSKIFLSASFGDVAVPIIDVRTVKKKEAGVWAGIIVGCVVGVGIVTGLIAVVATRRRRRRRSGGLGVARPGLKPPSLRKVSSTKSHRESVAMSITPSMQSSSSEFHIERLGSYTENENELSLRELYAAKLKMEAVQGHSGHGSPPPSMAVTPRPAVMSLSSPGTEVVMFENPVAGFEDAEQAAAPEMPEQKPRSNSPPPAVLAGWFKDARKKHADKKSGNLTRRQSFRT